MTQDSYASILSSYSNNGYTNNIADNYSDQSHEEDPLGLYGDYEDNYGDTFVDASAGDHGASDQNQQDVSGNDGVDNLMANYDVSAMGDLEYTGLNYN